MTRKNILIVSASIGAGHNQAAKAVHDELIKMYPGMHVNVVDFMADENSYLNSIVKDSYLKMINIFPDMYDMLYRWSQNTHGSKVQYLMAKAMKRSLFKLVKIYRPDLIVFTHPFPCGAAAYLKRKGDINIPIVGIITDYAVHRMWIYNEVDMYFVACNELKNKLVNEGIEDSKIHVTGIPISLKFNETLDKAGTVNLLNMDAERPVILIMGGGLGLGSINDAFNALNEINLPLQVVIVSGYNEELQQSISQTAKKSRHQVIVLGYTNYVCELMAAADLLITKPGALTISEALAANLPMVFFDPLPGQEEENALYISKQGAGIWVKSQEELCSWVTDIISDNNLRQKLIYNAKMMSKPKAVLDIVKLLINHITIGRNAVS